MYKKHPYPKYILDVKQVGDYDDWTGIIRSDTPPDPMKLSKNDVQIWQPPYDDLELYEEYFAGILKNRRPCVVNIPEISSIGGRSGDSYPVSFQKLLKQGRAMGITTISETQRVAKIDPNIMAQATHLFRFRLQNEYDERIADEFLKERKGDELSFNSPHGFYYRRLDTSSPSYYYGAWKEFIKGV